MTCERERTRRLAVLLAAMIVGLAGCTGYRLGTTLPKGIDSIYVPVFVNKSGEPLLENQATDAAKQEFQKDGTLDVMPEASQADLLLDVVLTKVELEATRFDRDNTKTAKEYRVNIHATLTVTVTRTAKVMTKKTIVGQTTFYPGADLNTSKREAMPKAAEDLAHKIVESAVEAW